MATSHALDYAYGVRDRRPDGRPALHRARLRAGLGRRRGDDRRAHGHRPAGATRRAASRSHLGIGDIYTLAWSVAALAGLLLTVVTFLCASIASARTSATSGATACPARSSARPCGSPPRPSGSPPAPELPAPSPRRTTVAIIGQAVNAVIATVLWAYREHRDPGRRRAQRGRAGPRGTSAAASSRILPGASLGRGHHQRVLARPRSATVTSTPRLVVRIVAL